MLQLNQRQINHGVFGLVTVGLFLLFLINLLTPTPAVPALDSAVAVIVFGGIWVAYWQRWKYAPQLFVFGLSLLTIFGIPQASIQDFVPSVLVVPAIALAMGLPAWVTVASAVAIFIGVALRAGGAGDYVDPLILTVSGMIVGAIVLSRLAVDNAERLEAAKREAEEARNLAELERTRAEQQSHILEQRTSEQERLLELVATLETPIIAVADGVLLAPIVGAIDSRRAQTIMTHLLQTASAQRAKQVILDISGLPSIDTQVAQALLQTSQALGMLGCRVIITGISATVATTITELGINLEGIATIRSPQEALSIS